MSEEGSGDDVSQGLLVLDACCVINLAATERMGEILDATGFRCVVAEYVATQEALGLVKGDEDPDAREPIDLSPLVGAGRLEIRTMRSAQERQEFVSFVAELDDGEAWTCALAKLEGGTVATDDRKTLRLLEKEGIRTIQTPEILHAWAKASGTPTDQIREVLELVERAASFRPRRNAPFSEWWREQRSD